MTLNKMLEEKILNKKIIETPKKDCIILREEYRKEPDMEVQVVALSPHVTAIRTSECGHLSALGEGPWRKMCDYLLIITSDCEIHVIFVELKKTLKPNKKETAQEQLRRSLPFLDYLLSVCEVEGSNVEKTRITTKYVIIAERLRKISKGRGLSKARKALTEHYKGIDIAMFDTTRLTLADLINN